MERGVRQALIAKTGDRCERYLPLWLHHRDTETVMDKLVSCWLPDAAHECIKGNLTDQELRKLVRFLALVHDLGKVTPCFQQKVAPLVEGGLEHLAACGLRWGALPNAGVSPHAIAGEILLLDRGSFRRVGRACAAIQSIFTACIVLFA